MATTTPNFGWSVPTSTDLVKDGATAIETLGDSIDASLVDLKGGTTGQVLAKASGTDMDFSWVAQDDSNAIQNALLTTTGDTIYASAASTPARLGVGTTGQVLTVAGGVPTWATPASGPTFIGCSAWNSTDYTITNASFTSALYNSEDYDTNGFHSTATNTSRFTIPAGQAGYYLVWANTYWKHPGTSNAGAANARFLKNGTTSYFTVGVPFSAYSTTTRTGVHLSGVLYLADGDYVEHQVYQFTGANLDTFSGQEHLNAGLTKLGA
jgi:hypothetical protein